MHDSPPLSSDWEPAPLEPVPIVRKPARPAVRIGGESFYVERDGQTLYLRHPVWSLLGSGASLLEAERDLRAEAKELADVMAHMSPRSLDYEAVRLYRFVLRIA